MVRQTTRRHTPGRAPTTDIGRERRGVAPRPRRCVFFYSNRKDSTCGLVAHPEGCTHAPTRIEKSSCKIARTPRGRQRLRGVSFALVGVAGLEPVTSHLRCTSAGRHAPEQPASRGYRTRTGGLTHPMRARYQLRQSPTRWPSMPSKRAMHLYPPAQSMAGHACACSLLSLVEHTWRALPT